MSAKAMILGAALILSLVILGCGSAESVWNKEAHQQDQTVLEKRAADVDKRQNRCNSSSAEESDCTCKDHPDNLD